MQKELNGENFQPFFEKVLLFADLANDARGTTTRDKTLNDIENQAKLVVEEVMETYEAIENNNPVGILDGVIDVLVTAIGLLQQLDESGFDTVGALNRVANDNLTKYTPDIEVALKSVSHYAKQGVTTRFVTIPDAACHVILDSNDKVRKPIDFVPTDLSQYVPKDFKFED